MAEESLALYSRGLCKWGAQGMLHCALKSGSRFPNIYYVCLCVGLLTGGAHFSGAQTPATSHSNKSSTRAEIGGVLYFVFLRWNPFLPPLFTVESFPCPF